MKVTLLSCCFTVFVQRFLHLHLITKKYSFLTCKNGIVDEADENETEETPQPTQKCWRTQLNDFNFRFESGVVFLLVFILCKLLTPSSFDMVGLYTGSYCQFISIVFRFGFCVLSLSSFYSVFCILCRFWFSQNSINILHMMMSLWQSIGSLSSFLLRLLYLLLMATLS